MSEPSLYRRDRNAARAPALRDHRSLDGVILRRSSSVTDNGFYIGRDKLRTAERIVKRLAEPTAVRVRVSRVTSIAAQPESQKADRCRFWFAHAQPKGNGAF